MVHRCLAVGGLEPCHKLLRASHLTRVRNAAERQLVSLPDQAGVAALWIGKQLFRERKGLLSDKR